MECKQNFPLASYLLMIKLICVTQLKYFAFWKLSAIIFPTKITQTEVQPCGISKQDFCCSF